MKLEKLNELIKSQLNEGKIEKLSHVISFLKMNRSKWSQMYGIDKKYIDDMFASEISSGDIFKFAAMFPRNSFKIRDITTGKLQQKMKAQIINPTEAVKAVRKANALAKFLLAMKTKMNDDSWLNGY